MRTSRKFVVNVAVLITALCAASYIATATGIAALPWLATFTTNFRLVLTGTWQSLSPATTHLWSVAVEEQFYMLWPAVAISVGVRAGRGTLIGAAIGAVLFRGAMAYSHAWLSGPTATIASAVLTPARMDSLALGGLLAFAARGPNWPRISEAFARVANLPLRWWAAALIALLLQVLFMSAFVGGRPTITLEPTFVATTFALGLTCVLVADPTAPVRQFLERPTMRLIGRRSYALYLWHVPINVALRFVWSPPRTLLGTCAYVVVAAAASWAAAAASWYIIERPALSLKRFAEYRPRTAAPLLYG